MAQARTDLSADHVYPFDARGVAKHCGVREGERVFEEHGASLVVDAKSLAFIDGARLDFVTEGLKQSFKFDNPNVDSSCSCGESFNVKAGVA